MASVYLEQLLESVETLPAELQRNFSLIRELDVQCDGTKASSNGRRRRAPG